MIVAVEIDTELEVPVFGSELYGSRSNIEAKAIHVEVDDCDLERLFGLVIAVKGCIEIDGVRKLLGVVGDDNHLRGYVTRDDIDAFIASVDDDIP